MTSVCVACMSPPPCSPPLRPPHLGYNSVYMNHMHPAQKRTISMATCNKMTLVFMASQAADLQGKIVLVSMEDA